MALALFPGRFQPFHYGHLKSLEIISKRFDFVIVGIRNMNEMFSPEQTAVLIKDMIKDMENTKIIIGLNSILNFDVVCTGNEKVAKMFPNSNVLLIPRQLDISATEIRDAIYNGLSLTRFVKSSTEKIIYDFKRL